MKGRKAVIDLVGKRFGKVQVVRFSHKKDVSGHKRRVWECVCDCGKIFLAQTGDLHQGHYQSCGCARAAAIAEANKKKRKAVGENAKNKLFNSYKRKAEQRGFAWELSKDEFILCILSDCHYCGVHPSTSTEKICRDTYEHIFYNGVDRVNNCVGYTISNSVPCCPTCNYAKRQLPLELFLEWVNRIAAFQQAKVA